MKLAICGSRELDLANYHLHDLIFNYITNGEIEVVSGGAKGIDSLARGYAVNKGYKYTEFPADWVEHGKAAGPIRNRQIAQYADQLLVIRHEDSVGSKNVASEFRKLNKPVVELVLPKPHNT